MGYKQTSAAKFVNHGEEGVGGGRGHGKGPLAGMRGDLTGRVCSSLNSTITSARWLPIVKVAPTASSTVAAAIAARV
jgi:hypothetical protein